MAEKNAHCSYCGKAYDKGQPWPRRCAGCGETSYVNPTPVAVLVLPVDDGVLTVRRNFGVQKGKLALPGGFIDLGETWQQAAAREIREEAGVVIGAEDVTLVDVHSAGNGTLLIFGRAGRRRLAELPPFVANDEASERVVVTTPIELAFQLHTRILAEFFAGRGSGPGR